MTPPGGRGTEHDHEHIRDVARQMRQTLANHAGTLPNLTSKGKVAASAFGSWDAAQALGRTVEQGNTQVVRAYQQFIDGFLAVAKGLEKAADNYREANEKTLSSTRSAGRRPDEPPTPAPTRATVQPME